MTATHRGPRAVCRISCRLGYFKREQLVDDIPEVAKEEVDREDSVQLECWRRSFIQWQRS